MPWARVCALALLLGCASARPAEDPLEGLALPAFATPSAGAPTSSARAGAPSTGAPTSPPALTRAGLQAVVGRGIGAFLGSVRVEPVVAQGRFVGFRVERADDLAIWNAAGTDLRLGDVVTRVNGAPIERPEQAQAVFEALRTAPEIRVDVLRAGRPVVLRQAVLEAAPAARDH